MKWHNFSQDQTSKSGVDGRWKILDDNHLLIYLNGSNHKTDWWNNLRLKRIELEDGIKVILHDFQESQWVLDFFEDIIENNDIQVITISGFSRGGAIAQIVVYLIHNRYKDVKVFGPMFASKRAGNRKFVKTISEYCIGYKRRGDIVPSLPPFPPFYSNLKPIKFGSFMFRFWESHEPRSYYEKMEQYKLR